MPRHWSSIRTVTWPAPIWARADLGLWFLEDGNRPSAEAVPAEITDPGGRGGEAWRLISEALAAAR